ncbi:hypothetical protein D2E26_0867 [Bifidobacterium dolichotidis]|uniref:MarR family transcriptional regulator n=1 Tax=Bifidobacterium dolichotidis TaxID=2306976 RepID=A0A430FPQ4_9BIFI|nr:hypothetical protein [Bifidobacterium dolichotidis]RSX54813.1 hypothetical protein D2E26_0867 [Bifidobacterium dolichotidis]
MSDETVNSTNAMSETQSTETSTPEDPSMQTITIETPAGVMSNHEFGMVFAAAQGWAQLYMHALGKSSTEHLKSPIVQRVFAQLAMHSESDEVQTIESLSVQLPDEVEDIEPAVQTLQDLSLVEQRSSNNADGNAVVLTEQGTIEAQQYVARMLHSIGDYLRHMSSPGREWFVRVAEESLDMQHKYPAQ